MSDAVVYKLYSLRPLGTAANQQLAVSTGTIATYFGNLAPPRGCLHVVLVFARDTAKPGLWTLDWTVDWTMDWTSGDHYQLCCYLK